MRITEVILYKVKSFDNRVSFQLDKNQTLFSISGKNGSGKSTVLKSIWLAQKLHFCEQLNDGNEHHIAQEDAKRLFNSPESYIEIKISHQENQGQKEKSPQEKNANQTGEELAEIRISYTNNTAVITYKNQELVEKIWNYKNPKNIILFIDASKGFSESTLNFDEINISNNNRNNLTLEAILHPESIFTGIYQQLVKDYVHDRLIPRKPDRLLYYKVAAEMFGQLIPNIELKNFSGNHKPGEFVLLGKTNADERKPLYDVRDFSSGEKALLSTLAFLCMSSSVSILLIDEPENHFHEGLLLKFIGLLKDLCSKNGILTWTQRPDTTLKKEWLLEEYKDYNLNQVIYSTHSKSLIYKTFSMGQNFIANKQITSIAYEKAETELRKLGLSTVYNKVIFVEGEGDNEALNYLIKSKNITIRPLQGSVAVIETFKRIASFRSYINESEFVFIVDSDNKSEDFFTNLRQVDTDLYDRCFIKLDRHELENYFLDPIIFKTVIDRYLHAGKIRKETPTEEEIIKKIVEIGRESLPQVLKKEISLKFQHIISEKFSKQIWGNKNFDWASPEAIENQIQQLALSNNTIQELHDEMKSATRATFGSYELATNENIIFRCDGKQVLAKLCKHYSQYCGVEQKTFKMAIYNIALEIESSAFSTLSAKIANSFSE